MAERLKEGMDQKMAQSPNPDSNHVCFNKEDGAWYRTGAVVCKNGHDWECKPSGNWTAKGTSDSCKI